MDFNRQQLVENIGNLIQQKNMKVGEVESAIGISTGYLSRLSKEGNSSIPATDVTWKLAQHFGVSTDALIAGDFSNGTDNISVLKKFLKKLVVRTMEGKLDWIPVTTQYVNAVLRGDESLFFLVEEKEKDRGIPQYDAEEQFSEVNRTHSFYKTRRIVSAASPLDPAWMTGNGFKAKLNENRWIYLFPMRVSFDTGTPAGDVDADYYEMYMQEWVPTGGIVGAAAVISGENRPGKWVTTQMFDTFRDSYSPLKADVQEVYEVADRTAYDVKINAGVKTAIMDFLNDGVAEEG